MAGIVSTIGAWGGQFLRGLVDLVYPGACWVCGRFDPSLRAPICPTCRPALVDDPFPTCPRCSSTVGPHVHLEGGCSQCRQQTFAFDRTVRLGPYQGLLREVVLRLKHRGGEGLAEIVADLWADIIAPRLLPMRPDLVVPIPLHWTRWWRRTFHAPDVMARRLARRLGRPCLTRLLRRRKRTAPLTSVPPSDRRREVKDAFAARFSQDLRGQTVVLVDDVLTTGATAHEAARVVRSMNPGPIVVAVLAHGR